MFVKCDAMADLLRMYTPKNNLCVWFEKFGSFALPLSIGKVVSFRSGKDRYRTMLRELAGRCPGAAYLPSHSVNLGPSIVALYLTRTHGR
jgi:hypothetical protein